MPKPDDMDMQNSTFTSGTGSSSQELPLLLRSLKGEYRHLLTFLLGEKDVLPQPPFNHPSWWMMAGLMKSPETIYSEFKDFSYNKSPREFLTGNL